MAITRSVELSPVFIDQVRESLSGALMPAQEKRLEAIAKRYLASREYLETTLPETRQQALVPAKVELAVMGGYLNGIQTRIDQTTTLVAVNPEVDFTAGRNPIIWGRIRSKLSHPDFKPPFPFSLLKGTLKHWALDEHPLLKPLTLEQKKALVLLGVATQVMREKTEAVEVVHTPKVEQASRDLRAAEKRFWDFCDSAAAISSESALRYLRVAPSQLTGVVKEFVNINLTAPSYRADLRAFAREDIAQVRQDTNHPHRRQYHGLLGSTRLEISYETLPPHLQNRWRTHLESRITQEWLAKLR